MAEAIRRDCFKNFWTKFSDHCDNTAMMLNHNADELEALDRADILACLPDLEGKDAVDIGAGIGRFTTVLAQTARYVLSTDFIESFIEKNQQRNAHHGNISYQVGDAVNLQLGANSVDLVFTNWLMMYLSDREVVQFLLNALRWLRPNGFIHLRESCSEPSTARTKGTMHNASETNPTSYRFSSLYIKLLRNIRYRDEDGVLYRFEVLWSCSVPTYVTRQSNWRQVHWLTKKVRAETDENPSFDCLLNKFTSEWKKEQLEWDAILDDEGNCWTDKVIEYALKNEDVLKNSTVLAYNPRKTAYHVHVNAHRIAEKFTCNVWDVETDEYYYRTSLTKANQTKDHRVRFGWNQNLSSSLSYWKDNGAAFDVFVATEFLATVDDETVKTLSSVMKAEASIILLEAFDEDAYNEKDVEQRLSTFKNVKIDDVTNVCTDAIKDYLLEKKRDESAPGKVWKVIRART